MDRTTITYFGEFSFCTQSFELRFKGDPVILQPQPSQLLAYLVLNANRIISREEIQDYLWPGRNGEFDQNLNFCINKLRIALREVPKHPKFLETIPKRGYRFKYFHQETNDSPLEQKRGFLGWINRKSILFILVFLVFGLTLVANNPFNYPPKSSAAITDFKRAEYLRSQYSQESVERSLPVYELALSADPEFAPAYAGLAYAFYFLNKDSALIESHVEKALALDSNNEMALLVRLALTFRTHWNINEAHKIAEHILEINPQHVRALHYLSLTSAILGDMEKATDAINRSLLVDPGATQVHSHAGWFFYLAGNFSLALKHCEASVQLEPDWTRGHYCSIQAASRMGLDRTVSRHVRELLRIYKANSETILQFESLPENELLKTFYLWDLQRQLNKIEPDHFSLALAYARTQNYRHALKQLRLAKNSNNIMLPTALLFPEFSLLKEQDEFMKVMEIVKR